MDEAAEEGDRETPTDPDTDPGVSIRVEPDAAVVSMGAAVPGHASERPAALRPVAAARAVGGRLRRLVGGRRSDARGGRR
ncbi:hypothetical protein [Halobaculum lipolyticum]|uniref:Uncharacterized protein n=1 Tax=Halobaculum lipolyticum TaxID=3032001 RepID=A0ABD5WK06_9EURY|nr:hypothetical protein [Halobaculum sp. DT31]